MQSARLFILLLLSAVLGGCSTHERPYTRGDRRVAGRERSIHASRSGFAGAGGAARDVPAARVFSGKRGIPRPCRSEDHLEQSDPGDADVHRSGAEDAARGHAGLHAERPAQDADRFRRGYGIRPAPALRAVCRSDERLRDVSRRALHRPRSHRNRPLRSGLQPRLSPVLLYNSTYDCPVPPRENRLAVPIRAGERLGAAGH